MEPNLRLLIDCENLSGRHAADDWAGVGCPVELFGRTADIALWEEPLRDRGIPVLRVWPLARRGENASDSMLAYRATRLGFDHRLVVVSGDGDLVSFTEHMTRLGGCAIATKSVREAKAFAAETGSPSLQRMRSVAPDGERVALCLVNQTPPALLAAWDAAGYRLELVGNAAQVGEWRKRLAARIGVPASDGLSPRDIGYGEQTSMRGDRSDLVFAARAAELAGHAAEIRLATMSRGLRTVIDAVGADGTPCLRGLIPPGTALAARWDEVRAREARMSVVVEAVASAMSEDGTANLSRISILLKNAGFQLAKDRPVRALVEECGFSADKSGVIADVGFLLEETSDPMPNP